MAQQLVTDIILNLGGNLARKAQQYGSSMAQFARKNQRAMGVVRQSAAAAGRGIDMVGNRYVALGATLVSGAAVTGFAALDRRLSRVAIAADLTKEKTNELYEEIQKVSNQEGIRIDPSEALAAIEEILTKTGDLDYAVKNLPNIATVIQATGADGLAVGGIFTEFKKLAINSSKDTMAAIDILNKQGKSGAFTLANTARLGPQIFAAYAATGRQGVQAAREIGAALQVIKGAKGTDDEAVTSFEALIRDITDPIRVKKLKRLGGIDVFDPKKLKQGVEVMRPLPELMTEIVEKSKGLSSNLAALSLTQEAKQALNPLIAEFMQSGDVKAFDQFMAITGDGTVTINDAKVAANDFAASLQLVNNSVKQYANTRLADPVAELAKAINSLEPEAIDRWLSAAGAVAGVGAAVIALRKTYKAGEWIAGGAKKIFGKGGKQDGKGGGFADLGAMPVYVVNMPGSGLGGSPDMDLPEIEIVNGLTGTESKAVLTGTQLQVIGNNIAEELAELSVDAVESGDSTVWRQLRVLRRTVLTDVRERAAMLPQINIYTPMVTEPVSLVAWRALGDTEKRQSIVRRNGLKNPAFILPGQNVEVVSG